MQEGGAGAVVLVRTLRVALRAWEGLALGGGDPHRQRGRGRRERVAEAGICGTSQFDQQVGLV